MASRPRAATTSSPATPPPPWPRNVAGVPAAGIEGDEGGKNTAIEGISSAVRAAGDPPVGNNLHGIALRRDDTLPPPLGPGQANEPAISGNIVGLNPSTL